MGRRKGKKGGRENGGWFGGRERVSGRDKREEKGRKKYKRKGQNKSDRKTGVRRKHVRGDKKREAVG